MVAQKKKKKLAVYDTLSSSYLSNKAIVIPIPSALSPALLNIQLLLEKTTVSLKYLGLFWEVVTWRYDGYCILYEKKKANSFNAPRGTVVSRDPNDPVLRDNKKISMIRVLVQVCNYLSLFHYFWQWRVLTAPFHHVAFADFWLADQLNSLVVAILDMEYLACFYALDFYSVQGKYSNHECFLLSLFQ